MQITFLRAFISSASKLKAATVDASEPTFILYFFSKSKRLIRCLVLDRSSFIIRQSTKNEGKNPKKNSDGSRKIVTFAGCNYNPNINTDWLLVHDVTFDTMR